MRKQFPVIIVVLLNDINYQAMVTLKSLLLKQLMCKYILWHALTYYTVHYMTNGIINLTVLYISHWPIPMSFLCFLFLLRGHCCPVISSSRCETCVTEMVPSFVCWHVYQAMWNVPEISFYTQHKLILKIHFFLQYEMILEYHFLNNIIEWLWKFTF